MRPTALVAFLLLAPLLAQDPPLSGVVAVPPHLVHPGATRSQGPENVGMNLKLNRDTGTAAQNEFGIAVNPRDADNVLACANDYRSSPVKCGFFASLDGARTVAADGVLPLAGGFPESGDPTCGFDAQGNGYVLGLHFLRSPQSGGLYLHKTTDGGRTFLAPMQVFRAASNLPDKPYLAIDPRTSGTFAGSFYVTFTGFGSAPTGLQCVYSRDGGQNWSAPVAIGSGQGTSPAVGPNGEVYVAWQSGGAIRCNVSTDGGASFLGARTIATITQNPSPLPPTSFRCNSFPSCAVDHSSGPYRGRVHVCWSSRVGSSSEILAVSSSDGGANWTAPVRVNDVTTGDQFFQWVTVDERGTVFACWQDRRHDPANRRIDCYASASYDGGATWIPNWRVSEVSSDPGSSSFIGDYSGIAAARGRCFPAWVDIQSGNQDAYTAPVVADLEVAPVAFSAAAGATIDLPVKCGPAFAGASFVLFMNASGTNAGVQVGAATVYLNWDPLVDLSFALRNQAPFVHTFGVLGAGGIPATQPQFTPAPGLCTPLVGLQLGFEALLFTPTLGPLYGSNPVLVRVDA
jgi:hypothetical protein